MTDDVMTRLREANPCPVPVVVPTTTMDERIAAILAADVAASPVDPPTLGVTMAPPRRPHRGWWVVAAIAVVIVAAGTIVAVQTNRARMPSTPAVVTPTPSPSTTDGATLTELPGGWHLYMNGFNIDVPPEWHLASRHFEFSIHSETIYWFSSAPLTVPSCSTTTQPDGTNEATCYNATVDLGGAGSMIVFDFASNDTPIGIDAIQGTRTTVGGHTAVIQNDPRTARQCSGSGAATTLTYFVADDEVSNTFFTVDVCSGPGATAQGQADVDRMIASITFDS